MKKEVSAEDLFSFQNGVYRRTITRIYLVIFILLALLIWSVIDSIKVRNENNKKMNELIEQINENSRLINENSKHILDMENNYD